MISKLYRMRKTDISEKGSLILGYYLTLGKTDSNKNIYGVKIIKYIDQWIEEEESSGAITYDEEEAYNVLKILSDNIVTPCSLINILDDFAFSV